MLKRTILFILIFTLCVIFAHGQPRSFDDIFPSMDKNIRDSVFTSSGYYRSGGAARGFDILGAGTQIDPQIIDIVLVNKPNYLAESILVIDVKQRAINILDIYNALQNIRDLKGRLYNSYARKQSVPLFEDATRIRDEKQTTAIPDPPPAASVPEAETVFVRLKDANFGNTFYRGDMVLVQNGLRYSLTNFRPIMFLVVPVMKEGKFFAQLYIEPILEGVMIYSIAGGEVSDFVSSKIDMDSAIAKRLNVITAWAIDGIIGK